MHAASRTGFTIVELLIVIVVVAILAAVSIATYNGLQDRAYSTKAIAVVDNITKALGMYHVEAGHYPPSLGAIPVCIGEVSDYPAKGSYGAGVCDSQLGRSVSTTFNNELKRYISGVPDGSLPSIEFGGGEGVRGVIYVSDTAGSYMRLTYLVRGDQSCPRGVNAAPQGSGMTACDFTLPEDAVTDP